MNYIKIYSQMQILFQGGLGFMCFSQPINQIDKPTAEFRSWSCLGRDGQGTLLSLTQRIDVTRSRVEVGLGALRMHQDGATDTTLLYSTNRLGRFREVGATHLCKQTNAVEEAEFWSFPCGFWALLYSKMSLPVSANLLGLLQFRLSGILSHQRRRVVLNVRWYLRYSLSYRDLEELRFGKTLLTLIAQIFV